MVEYVISPEKGASGIQKKLKTELKSLDQNYIALVLAEAKVYQETNIALLQYMIDEKNIPGVYVTINKPYNTMKRILENEGINTDMIIFIDAISKSAGGTIEKAENCLFIGSPENLTDISVALTEATQAIPSDKKFVFFDSLSTLLLYNNMGTVARFTHFLTGKMRAWGVEGILISVEKESDEVLLSQLSQFCDKVITLGGEDE